MLPCTPSRLLWTRNLWYDLPMTAAMAYPDVVVEWRVPEILKEHGLSAYKLAEVLAGKVNRNSAYDIAAGRSKRVDRETLYALVLALRSLTGNKALGVGDLFAFIEDDAQLN